MPKTRKREARPAIDPCRGDCFVVHSLDGSFWNGRKWVEKWQEALQFGGPLDPFTPCDALAARLRSRGFACDPAYIPKVVDAKVRRAEVGTA